MVTTLGCRHAAVEGDIALGGQQHAPAVLSKGNVAGTVIFKTCAYDVNYLLLEYYKEFDDTPILANRHSIKFRIIIRY